MEYWKDLLHKVKHGQTIAGGFFMLLEELEWKLGGRIKSVCIVLLMTLLMWGYAGSTYADGTYADSIWEFYIKCWERLCMF